jgi:hypothetical protein
MIGRSARAFILAATCVASAVAAVPSAHAESKFDGSWNVVVVTKSGPCQTYHFLGQIIDGLLHYAAIGPNNLFGRVAPSGAVTVVASAGGSNGAASGRLSGSSGSGSWRVHLPNSVCSGDWSAQRD